MRLLLIGLLITTQVQAVCFTLNTNTGAYFKRDKINVIIPDNSGCINAFADDNELASAVAQAIAQYWNKVPTARLNLEYAGVQANGGIAFRTGQLTDFQGEAINDIYVTCNTNAADYPSGSVLGKALPVNVGGDSINGSVVTLNDTGATQLATKNFSEKVAVIAHELGHAIGLGHSPAAESLMFYSTVTFRSELGICDIDGATYLYGNEITDVAASCGTVQDINNSNDHNNPISFLLGFAMIALIVGMKKLGRRLL